jgi:hypothetical protein
MSFYTLRRLLVAALREGLVWYAATAGERLARKHVRLPTVKRPRKRKDAKR